MTKNESTKDIIAKAAVSCFAKQGLTSTSIQDIANEANVSKSLVFYYYKNKEKGYVASEEDLKALGANNKRLKMLSGKKREVQKAYKIPVWKAVNMELIHEFNNSVFGDKKVMYVCKKLMMEREMLRINFYHTKFRANERTY